MRKKNTSCFNSTIVRLKGRGHPQQSFAADIRFNSTIVRLKVSFCGLLKQYNKFQFYDSAIKRIKYAGKETI